MLIFCLHTDHLAQGLQKFIGIVDDEREIKHFDDFCLFLQNLSRGILMRTTSNQLLHLRHLVSLLKLGRNEQRSHAHQLQLCKRHLLRRQILVDERDNGEDSLWEHLELEVQFDQPINEFGPGVLRDCFVGGDVVGQLVCAPLLLHHELQVLHEIFRHHLRVAQLQLRHHFFLLGKSAVDLEITSANGRRRLSEGQRVIPASLRVHEGVVSFVAVEIRLEEVGEFAAEDALLHVSVKLLQQQSQNTTTSHIAPDKPANLQAHPALPLRYLPQQPVRKELAQNLASLLHEPAYAVHAVRSPFSPVITIVFPLVNSQALALVLLEVASIHVPAGPFVNPKAVLAPIKEVTLILFVIAENEFSFPVFEVSRPLSLVNVSVCIFIDALETLVVSKSAGEGVSVKERKIAFNFCVVSPSAFKNCALAEVVSPLTFLSPLLEVSSVNVLVGVLKRALSMWQIIQKFTSINAAIFVCKSSFSIFVVVLELTFVRLLKNFVEQFAFSFFFTISPFSLIILFLTDKLAQTVLLVVSPSPLVVSCSLIVVIRAKAILKSLLQGSLIDLSTAKDVYTFAVEEVLFPISEVHVSNRIVKYSLTFSQFFSRDLPLILAICECNFFTILQNLYGSVEFMFFCLEFIEEMVVFRLFGRAVEMRVVAHLQRPCLQVNNSNKKTNNRFSSTEVTPTPACTPDESSRCCPASCPSLSCPYLSATTGQHHRKVALSPPISPKPHCFPPFFANMPLGQSQECL